MFKKTILTSIFIFAVFFTSSGRTYSQDDNTGTIQIVLPEINIGTYDGYGYDKEGYDRYGYDRSGYNREGYNQKGYNRDGYNRNGYDYYGYDRQGYDINGYDRNGNYKCNTQTYKKEKKHKHDDNGKHKGWYKNKKNKHNDEHDDNDDD